MKGYELILIHTPSFTMRVPLSSLDFFGWGVPANIGSVPN